MELRELHIKVADDGIGMEAAYWPAYWHVSRERMSRKEVVLVCVMSTNV
nr:hypothetical protein [Paenibacillus brasilensis]